MVIGSAPGDVAAVLTAFTHFATPARMPEAARRDLLVVLDELLANVVMHGVGPTPNGSASVAVQAIRAAMTTVVPRTRIIMIPSLRDAVASRHCSVPTGQRSDPEGRMTGAFGG